MSSNEDYMDDVESFFQEVMKGMGHEGWVLQWQRSDAYCWLDSKVIDICPMKSIDECKQMLLHEIAHIDTPESHGSWHTPRFWRHLGRLTTRYLESGLDQRQKTLMVNYCPELVSTDLHLT